MIYKKDDDISGNNAHRGGYPPQVNAQHHSSPPSPPQQRQPQQHRRQKRRNGNFTFAVLSIAAFLILLIAIFFVVNFLSNKNDIPKDNSTTVADNTNIQLKMITGPDGFYGGYANGNESGYYNLNVYTCPSDALNIIYTDYATAKTVFLCGKPECKHSDETCTSWFSRNVGSGYILADDSQLFYIHLGAMGANGQDYGDDAFAKIYKLDLNGENRQLLYKFPANEWTDGSICSDGDNFYFFESKIEKANADSPSQQKNFVSINKTTGEKVVIAENIPSDSMLLHAYADKIYVLQTSEDYVTQINTYSIDFVKQGVLKEWANGCDAKKFSDNCLMYYDESSNSVMKLNLDTNEEKPAIENFKKDNSVQIIPGNAMQGKSSWSTVSGDIVAGEERVYEKFVIDLKTDDVFTSTIRVEQDGEKYPLSILAENSKYYLVDSGTKILQKTTYGKDNVPQQIEMPIPVRSLISKEDFYNNNPNFIEIADETLG